MMVFNEIDNFIEVYNNSVIELIQCFGTSFFGRIDHLASSVIKFRPKNSVPKHCIRSITYNYYEDLRLLALNIRRDYDRRLFLKNVIPNYINLDPIESSLLYSCVAVGGGGGVENVELSQIALGINFDID